MMRIGRNSVLMLIGALAFFTVLAVAAPAALIAPQIKDAAPGISFHSIRGTVWRARVQGVQADGVPIGNLRADFILHRLLTGNIAYRVTASGGAVNGGAIASQSLFGASEIDDANIKIERALLQRYALMGVRVDGTAAISGARILMKSSRCVEAQGAVETDALGAISKQYGLGEIGLSGTIACAEENLTVRLHGDQAEFGEVSIDLTQLPGSRYKLRVRVQSDDAALKQALQLGGFENADGAMIYEEIASWATQGSAPERMQNRSVADGV